MEETRDDLARWAQGIGETRGVRSPGEVDEEQEVFLMWNDAIERLKLPRRRRQRLVLAIRAQLQRVMADEATRAAFEK